MNCKVKMKETVEGLLPINCFNNFKIGNDGRCYSSTCMLNADAPTAEKIKEKGCMVFVNHPDVVRLRKERG